MKSLEVVVLVVTMMINQMVVGIVKLAVPAVEEGWFSHKLPK